MQRKLSRPDKRHRLIMLFLLLSFLLVFALIFFLSQKQIEERVFPSQSPSMQYPANIDFEPMDSYGTYNPAALTNPNVGAVDINMNWVNVEPQEGVFNWQPVDNEVAAWAEQGKKFVLIIRYIKEGGSEEDCNSPQWMPDWEIARIQSFCDMSAIIPNYFDPTFKADLKAFIQAIAQHFEQSSYKDHLLYVRIGLGVGGEGFPLLASGNYQAAKDELTAYGYTPQDWAAWQREMLSFFKSVLPHTVIIYPVNGQDTDPTTDQPVQVENAYWAAANGFGVGQQGLRPGTTFPLFQTLRAKYPALYIQYQTISLAGSYKHVQADIEAADRNGAQFVEWYTRDIVNPAYQPLFAQWQQTVSARFADQAQGQGSLTAITQERTPLGLRKRVRAIDSPDDQKIG